MREDGGGHEAENLVTLCGAHHRSLHRGTLTLERVGAGLGFRHADGTEYGTAPVLVHATHGGPETAEALVRRCLLLLTERWARAS